MRSLRSRVELIYDVCVIGSGMSGMAATLFAANRCLTVLQVGSAGEILFASGLLDLLGIHPIEKKKSWRDPWAGITALARDLPQHPYARINQADIRAGFEELVAFLNAKGLAYRHYKRRNQEVVTSMGTTKMSYCLPQTMWNGAEAFRNNTPCLVVDFKGLKGFSAYQIAQTLADKWPNMRSLKIEFPGLQAFSEVHPERLARLLEFRPNRLKLAQLIRPHLKKAGIVGFPTILGINGSWEVMADLEEHLGCPVFEIPSMPPSAAGLRLKETFEQHLPSEGVILISYRQVLQARRDKKGFFMLDIGHTEKERTVRSRAVVLATGRFIGGGLHADRNGVCETLFNLPVAQPEIAMVGDYDLGVLGANPDLFLVLQPRL